MEAKTKNFLWGIVSGVALLVVAIAGLFAYLYLKGTEFQTEAAAHKQMEEAEQIRRFGTTCTNAVPETMAYFFKKLEPSLKAMQEGRLKNEQLPELAAGVKIHAEFLRHCSGKVVSIKDEDFLKISRQLIYASSELSAIDASLYPMQLSECDLGCQQVFAKQAIEASRKLENLLRGNES